MVQHISSPSTGKVIFEVVNLNAGINDYSITFNGDNKYNQRTIKGSVNVLSKAKENLTLTPSSKDITEGQTLTISVDLPADINSTLSLTINGKSYTTKATNGVALFAVDGMKAGSYEYTVKFDGDDKYNSASCKGSVNVLSKSKENIKLTVDADDICEGEKLTVNVELSADISSTLTLSIDGKTYSAKSQNGKANFIVPDLKAGSYEFTVSFSGDDKYNPISEKSTVDVLAKSKENTTLYISCDDIVEGETLTVDVVLPADITSALSLTINGKTYSSSSTNGIATFTVSDLKSGSYEFTVSFGGDDKHNHASEKSNVKVSKAKENITLLISCGDIDEGENAIVTVILPADISSNLSLSIAGKTYSAESSNGVATFNIANLKSGSYDFTVGFSGDDKYNPASEKSEIPVNKVKQNITLSLSNIGSEINVILSKGISADLSLTINNKTYSLKAENGKAKFNAGNLKAGTYDYSVTFDGDENYNPAGSKSSLTVKEAEKTKTTPEIISTDNVKANADNVNVKLPENATGSVIVYVDGKQHSSSQLVNGTADISLTDLAAGAHLIEVKYSGDDQYSEVTSHSAILINETIKTPVKIGTIIEVESAFTRLANDYFAGERGDYFYAILKDINGNVLANKMVQIAVNGPIYNVTTDKDGRAGLQVNLANANVYTYALSFKGDGEYLSAPMASSKLTVTKKSTSITAASKTFKVKSKKTVSVTLNTIKKSL